MNKKVIILVGIILCMLFNVMKPMVVNAIEIDSIQEGQIADVNSNESNDLEEDDDALLKQEEPDETNQEMPTTGALDESSEPETEDTTPDLEYGEIYDIQKVKVITSKTGENDELLSGARLQILDKDGRVLDEWVSTTEEHETLLSDGTYILHEVEAPEGYDLADDVEFTVKVEIAELDAGSDASATPCPHYTGTQMYYVEIKGEKHEVYCINQNWDTPDADSKYDGEILNSDSIRDYTKQTVPVDLDEENPIQVIMSDGPIDVSDQSLSDQELYDKILDIIYHRHTAVEDLGKQGYTYTTEEIRFITEVALKNYTNAGITERQYNVKATEALLNAFDAAGVVYKTYTRNGTLYVSYLKHNYRDYVYVADSALGQDIVKTDYGKGNSFGQMVAGHWNSYSSTNYLHPDADSSTQAHNAKNKQEDRDTVARYYVLFEYLISSNNPHPSEMNLYIYSSDTTPQDPAGNNYDAKYQNLLGVTGYFEEIPQQEQRVTMQNKYSTETVEVTITKVWNDANNQDGKRPASIIVALNNGQEVELNESNNWTATIANLPKYDHGQLITYTWNEVSTEGYELISTEVDETGYVTTITNQPIKSIKVLKVWADDNNESQKRPKNITISLLANGKEYDTIVLSEENEWNYTFTNLPVYDDGEKITYTIREDDIPEDYEVAYEENEEGFIIHNVLGRGGDEPPKENPQTGDNVVLYLILLVISIVGFISGKQYLKENN